MTHYNPEHIFLSGFMGAGKTTVGKKLARRLETDFIDLDSLVEQKAGVSVREIFEKKGEKFFRKMERRCLQEVIRGPKGVVSLGGGSLQNQQLVDFVKLNGLLVFLETPFSVIFDRLKEQKDRPLLLDDEGNFKEQAVLKEELRTLYNSRLPLYEQAEMSIDSSEYESADKLVTALTKKIRDHVSHD